jgi:hypothetical protein
LAAIIATYFAITYGMWRYQSSVCEDLSDVEHAALSAFVDPGHEVKSATKIQTDDGIVIGAITALAGSGGGATYRTYRCVGPDCSISQIEIGSSHTDEEGWAEARGERCLAGWMK